MLSIYGLVHARSGPHLDPRKGSLLAFPEPVQIVLETTGCTGLGEKQRRQHASLRPQDALTEHRTCSLCYQKDKRLYFLLHAEVAQPATSISVAHCR